MVRFGEPKRQIFVPYNGKIADIKYNDTSKHTLDLAAALGETRKIIAIAVMPTRIGGTGEFYVYPNEGTTYTPIPSTRSYGFTVIANGTQRLQYSEGVANDDWDLYCMGYVVEA